MKIIPLFALALSFFLLGFLSAAPHAALAQEVGVAAIMQRCSSAQECTAVPTSCASACAASPVNALYTEILDRSYRQLCNKAPDQASACTTAKMSAACVDGRCVLIEGEGGPMPDAAALINAPSEPAPTPSGDIGPRMKPILEGDPALAEVGTQMPVESPAEPTFNDKDGKFSAYNLSPEDVRANILREHGLK